jgi:hypothetical protein
MHPELALVVDGQRERELDAELRRRVAIRERGVFAGPAVPTRPRVWTGVTRLVNLARRRARPTLLSSPAVLSSPTVCCAAA